MLFRSILVHLINGNTKVNEIKFDYFKAFAKGILYVIVNDAERRPPKFKLSLTVPKGHLFVVGDNRDYSVDSRALGPIPLSNMVGIEIGMSNVTRTEKTLLRLRPKE